MNAEQPRQSHSSHHRPVLEFAAVWMLAAACSVAGVLIGGLALSMDDMTPLASVARSAAGIVAMLFLAAAVVLVAYARLEHFATYGRQQRTVKSDPAGIVYLTQRMTVAGEPVDRDAKPVSFGVDPDLLKRALAYVKGGGETSRAKMTKALGLSQKQWQNVMAGLEDMGAVTNNGRAGIAADLAEVGRLLDELDAQGW